MNTRIQRENGKVWLEGVQGWSAGEKQSSVHAAQEAAMLAVGEQVSYHTLLGISGLAFRMQVSIDGLCPSSPHSFCGYRCVQRAVQALPWNIDFYEIKPTEAEGVAGARRAVVESIEHGVPVQYGSEEDGLVVGYQNDGQEWLVLHPYKEGGKKMVIETAWPWGIVVFTWPKAEPADPFELSLGALHQAVEMANTEEKDGYFVGFKAWQAYPDKLTNLLQTAPETRQESMLGNAWIYECLVQYRRSAAIFLRQLAVDYPGSEVSHLHKAASRYEKMANHVLCDPEKPHIAIAPYPWMLSQGEHWSEAQIQGQILRLEEAFALEQEAMSDLEQAILHLEKGGNYHPLNT